MGIQKSFPYRISQKILLSTFNPQLSHKQNYRYFAILCITILYKKSNNVKNEKNCKNYFSVKKLLLKSNSIFKLAIKKSSCLYLLTLFGLYPLVINALSTEIKNNYFLKIE